MTIRVVSGVRHTVATRQSDSRVASYPCVEGKDEPRLPHNSPTWQGCHIWASFEEVADSPFSHEAGSREFTTEAPFWEPTSGNETIPIQSFISHGSARRVRPHSRLDIVNCQLNRQACDRSLQHSESVRVTTITHRTMSI